MVIDKPESIITALTTIFYINMCIIVKFEYRTLNINTNIEKKITETVNINPKLNGYYIVFFKRFLS